MNEERRQGLHGINNLLRVEVFSATGFHIFRWCLRSILIVTPSVDTPKKGFMRFNYLSYYMPLNYHAYHQITFNTTILPLELIIFQQVHHITSKKYLRKQKVLVPTPQVSFQIHQCLKMVSETIIENKQSLIICKKYQTSKNKGAANKSLFVDCRTCSEVWNILNDEYYTCLIIGQRHMTQT